MSLSRRIDKLAQRPYSSKPPPLNVAEEREAREILQSGGALVDPKTGRWDLTRLGDEGLEKLEALYQNAYQRIEGRP